MSDEKLDEMRQSLLSTPWIIWDELGLEFSDDHSKSNIFLTRGKFDLTVVSALLTVGSKMLGARRMTS